MPPSNTLPGVGITKSEFNKRYWFTSLQMVTVKNPLARDYPFTVELRHYIVKAGQQESFVGPIVNVYLNHIAKNIAQEKEELALMSDHNYMAEAYNSLIVDVRNLAPEYNPQADWQARAAAATASMPPWMQAQQQQPQEDTGTPPWQQPPQEQAPLPAPNMERSTSVAQTLPPPVPQASPAPQLPQVEQPQEETKEFELEGVKYRSITTKGGGTMHYKGGKLTSAAEYSKAASML